MATTKGIGADKPRLSDVAARAGVSKKTVSNVINDYTHISARTRNKVLTAIEELGYTPNLSARNLARGRSGIIVLAVPRLDMPYFASLAMLLIEEAERGGWLVQVRQTRGDAQVERALLSSTPPVQVDGLVLSHMRLQPDDLEARRAGVPLVLLGEHDLPAADHVGIDNVAAARTAVEHLVQTGRRRIAMAGETLRPNLRLQGYQEAMTAAGLPVDESLQLRTRGVTGQDGEQAMDAFLRTGRPVPEAVFCVTDWLAMGVIRSLRLHGHRVPEDVAVMGFDDIPYDLAALPTLSTISPDRAEIARLALQSLHRQESAPGSDVVHAVAGHRLVVRESTTAVTGGAAVDVAGAPVAVAP